MRIGRVQVQTRRVANRIKRFATRLTVTAPLELGSLPTEEEGVSSSASFHTSVHVHPLTDFYFDSRLTWHSNRKSPTKSLLLTKYFARKGHGYSNGYGSAEPFVNQASYLLQFHFSPHNAKRQNFLGLVSRLRKASSLRLNLN